MVPYFRNVRYVNDRMLKEAFYPTGSAAWVISNEEFLKGTAVSLLKLRASAGLSGFSDSSATSVLADYSSNGRYLFKDYYTYSYIGSFYTGASSPSWQSTLVPMFVPNENAHAEKSLKFNVGLDARIGGFSLTADAFLDKPSSWARLPSTRCRPTPTTCLPASWVSSAVSPTTTPTATWPR